MQPFLKGWSGEMHARIGNWTGDGGYFLFTSDAGGRWDIWALPERTGIFHRQPIEPIRLSAGPFLMEFRFQVATGRKSMLWVRCAAGRWFASTRLRSNGCLFSRTSPLLMLHSRGMASGSYTSPTQITLSGDAVPTLIHGEGRAIYAVSMQGGRPRMLAEAAVGSKWSPDGKELMFGGLKSGFLDYELRKLDLQTGEPLEFCFIAYSFSLIKSPHEPYFPSRNQRYVLDSTRLRFLFSFNGFSFSLISAPGDKPCSGADIGELDPMPEAWSWPRSSDRRTLRGRHAAWPRI